MKLQAFAVSALLIALGALPASGAPAGSADAKPLEKPVLTLVVVTSLAQGGDATPSAYTDFDRLDLAFQDVAKRRHWPVRIVAERFAANTPAHPLELRVFLQPVGNYLPSEFDFRAWMTLNDHGTKHDFGMIVHREELRAGENVSDFLERLFHRAAEAAAKKIEPVLFPQLVKPRS
ncbi:MAG TPA: hypothetical protein VG710_11880 [Opitutus sp.]|nr:hypothetical protein [Opitutus sp.]